MANTVPDVAPRILERALERIKLRANSNGECFGGEIMESLREAGVDLGAHHVEILQTRTALVRTMESLGEAYPADILPRLRQSNPAIQSSEVFECSTRVGDTPAELWLRLSREGVRLQVDTANQAPEPKWHNAGENQTATLPLMRLGK
jgi:hypothetical protein